MVGNGRVSRRSGTPCWTMFASFAVVATLLMCLASPVSADDDRAAPWSQAYSEEGENLTTPATPLRRFVWRVRNWMFHRDDADTNIEVDATEATEPTNGGKMDGDYEDGLNKSRSWARSLAAWFARGIRSLLEQLSPPDDSTAGGNSTGRVPFQDETTGYPDDKRKDSDSDDSVIKSNRHNVFRPWTALPPPPPPGMTASPGSSSTTDSMSSSENSPGHTKPSTTVGIKDTAVGSKGITSGSKSSTAGSKSTSGAPTTSSSPKKPKRRRPKPISTSTTIATTEMPPPLPPVSTEETFIQDNGNEI